MYRKAAQGASLRAEGDGLLTRYPRVANLRYVYGYACAREVDLWGALAGYEPAQELLPRLELITRPGTGFDSFFERQRKREQAKRASLQAVLMVPNPSLRDALSLYTKEVLTGMGHVILPWGAGRACARRNSWRSSLPHLSRGTTWSRLQTN